LYLVYIYPGTEATRIKEFYLNNVITLAMHQIQNNSHLSCLHNFYGDVSDLRTKATRSPPYKTRKKSIHISSSWFKLYSHPCTSPGIRPYMACTPPYKTRQKSLKLIYKYLCSRIVVLLMRIKFEPWWRDMNRFFSCLVWGATCSFRP
jgi:hypothetical protein